MSKKIYRSLFDSDEVFEVESISDDDEKEIDIETKKVKKEVEDEGEVTLEKIFGLLKDIEKKIGGSSVADSDQDSNTGGSTAGCEPDGEMKVTQVNPIIDEDDVKKVEEMKVETEKEVKDAYSGFVNAGARTPENPAQATQVAFQNRYNKVANR